jgi:hypothetical protein
MKIGGPYYDKLRRGQPKPWYLSRSTERKNPDGSSVIGTNGKALRQRQRTYYESKSLATADIPRIRAQQEETGSSGYVLNRKAAEEYEIAKKITGENSLVEVAKFWRLHHPATPKAKLGELLPGFLKDLESRVEKGRHVDDRTSRLGAFLRAGYDGRYPETVTRANVLDYVKGIADVAPRTRRNHKTAIVEFFNWLVEKQYLLVNPASGIRKRHLPKEKKQEIRFLKLDQVERYLRAAERYDPKMVPHEIVQLIAGVRADDEMAKFRAEMVLPETREVLVPSEVAKTEEREVIENLEESFWAWWKAYGPKEGLLRPKYYDPRWYRLRVLSQVADQKAADELARLPIKTLLAREDSKTAMGRWPWNARRRTFCTYHVAKYQSADKTALLLRHRGSPYTLHNSYRGLGVTQAQGVAYFNILPKPCRRPIRPERPERGIIVQQRSPSLP